MTTTKRRRSKAPVTGYELWRGASWFDGSDIVAIATLHSDNVKTGDIILFANTATGCPALPSSLALDNEHLYVGDRKKKQIIRFKIANGECDKKPFSESLPDAPEFMIPSTPMPPASKVQPTTAP